MRKMCIFAPNWCPPLSLKVSKKKFFVCWQSCPLMLVQQLMFSAKKKKILLCKIFQEGPRGSKHNKFKSKKQKNFNLFFFHMRHIYTLVKVHKQFILDKLQTSQDVAHNLSYFNVAGRRTLYKLQTSQSVRHHVRYVNVAGHHTLYKI